MRTARCELTAATRQNANNPRNCGLRNFGPEMDSKITRGLKPAQGCPPCFVELCRSRAAGRQHSLLGNFVSARDLKHIIDMLVVFVHTRLHQHSPSFAHTQNTHSRARCRRCLGIVKYHTAVSVPSHLQLGRVGHGDHVPDYERDGDRPENHAQVVRPGHGRADIGRRQRSVPATNFGI